MAKSDKLARQQSLELEARSRIPKKTQELLGKMISRRFAELCGPKNGGRKKRIPYMPELLPPLAYERECDPQSESEAQPELQFGARDADL